MADDRTIPNVSIPLIQGGQDDPPKEYTIPVGLLKPVQGQQDDPIKKRTILLNGKMITSEDPLIIGQNFRNLINMRYGEGAPRTVAGMTKINTTVLTTYLKVRSAFHFRKNYESDK